MVNRIYIRLEMRKIIHGIAISAYSVLEKVFVMVLFALVLFAVIGGIMVLTGSYHFKGSYGGVLVYVLEMLGWVAVLGAIARIVARKSG